MMNNAEKNTIIGLIRDRIDDPIAIYLFGSRATEAVHEKSDIDIAVLPTEALDGSLRWDVQQDLAIALHSPVDLVDLRSASTVMRFQVVSNGELLFEADRTARAEFEMTTLSMYTRFNVERREILEQVARDGRVYG
ncbi:MAG: nucleotidyltransferase domain-containing protein [Thermoanaerobaculales bacterium]|jgi:predicted nucleotidyltransferase|nr:nucleotidyltransferase domain-containing protein [Thermoanaerobaculales bacterium]